MIGKQKSQFSLLDSAFSARTKRSRTDKLLSNIVLKNMLTGTALNLFAFRCIRTQNAEDRVFQSYLD